MTTAGSAVKAIPGKGGRRKGDWSEGLRDKVEYTGPLLWHVPLVSAAACKTAFSEIFKSVRASLRSCRCKGRQGQGKASDEHIDHHRQGQGAATPRRILIQPRSYVLAPEEKHYKERSYFLNDLGLPNVLIENSQCAARLRGRTGV